MNYVTAGPIVPRWRHHPRSHADRDPDDPVGLRATGPAQNESRERSRLSSCPVLLRAPQVGEGWAMCARTISSHVASTSGDGARRLTPQPWSHAHPSDPPHPIVAAPPPRQLPGPVPGRVRDGAAGAAVPDADRARLRPRLPGLHQPPEHGPDRRQLRGQQPGGLGRRRRTRRSRRSTRTRSSPTPTGDQLRAPEVGRQAGGPGADVHRRDRRRRQHGLGDTVRVQLDCTFDVITPFISAIVGGQRPGRPPSRTSRSRPG